MTTLLQDLNPIENLRGIISNKIYNNRRQFNAIAEFKNGVLFKCEKTISDLVQKLAMSIPNRIVHVILTVGAHTKY